MGYVRELRAQYRQRRIRGLATGDYLRSPALSAAAFQRLLGQEPVEVVGVFCLSTRHEILAYHELSRGTLDLALVYPRDVFRTALLANARVVILGHNHPSGDPHPSDGDVQATAALAEAGAVVGLDVLDHVIVTPTSYFSFRESGRL